MYTKDILVVLILSMSLVRLKEPELKSIYFLIIHEEKNEKLGIVPVALYLWSMQSQDHEEKYMATK